MTTSNFINSIMPIENAKGADKRLHNHRKSIGKHIDFKQGLRSIIE